MIMVSRDNKTVIVTNKAYEAVLNGFQSFSDSAQMNVRCHEAIAIMETLPLRTFEVYDKSREWIEYRKADWAKVVEAADYVKNVCLAWYDRKTDDALYGNGPDTHFTDSTMDDASDLYAMTVGIQLLLADDYIWLDDREMDAYLIDWKEN